MQAYNALPYEESKFNEKVQHVFELAKKEAIASGIFFGSTGWSGNVTLLALLGYGEEFCRLHAFWLSLTTDAFRWLSG